MGAGRDLVIDINDPNNWTLRADETRTAGIDPITKRVIVPIPDIEILAGVRSRYVAVAPLISQGKPTWKFGGRISANYPFPDAVTNLDRIHNEFLGVGANRINLVSIPFVSRDFYRLTYTAPRWFKDVRLIAWQYIGEEYDYIESAVYSIQKALDQALRG